MEQQLNLDLPKKFMECKENIDEQIKATQAAIEIILEEAKFSGAQKVIDAAQAVYNNAVEALIPSNQETAKNYEEASEELQRLFAAIN